MCVHAVWFLRLKYIYDIKKKAIEYKTKLIGFQNTFVVCYQYRLLKKIITFMFLFWDFILSLARSVTSW